MTCTVLSASEGQIEAAVVGPYRVLVADDAPQNIAPAQAAWWSALLAGELVLIVEDNDRNLELVRDLLQVKGYRTIEAGTAQGGVALAAAHHPDLVLMDVQLPDEDGVTALERIRAHAGLASTPVVALTAFAMRHDREQFIAAGFDGYIAKPIEIGVFLDEVRRFCERTGAEG